MKTLRTFFQTLLLALLPAAPLHAQVAGTLDAAFNPSVAGGNAAIYATAVQPDGKIVIGGSFTSVGGLARNNLARLNADGSVESTVTFNTGTGASSIVTSLAVQADGKLVIGGGFTTVNGQSRNGIARLNADGTVESTATFNPGTGSNSINGVSCLAMQADGKIVIGGGFTAVNGQARRGIARLNADGTIESTATFDPGIGVADGAGFFSVDTVAVQADGKILLGGRFFSSVNGQPRNHFARLNADGTVESTATFNLGTGADNTVNTIAVQADGKILLGGGFTNVNGQARSRIARLNTDGTVESTATFNGSITAGSVVRSIALQADGKILVAGFFTSVNGVTRNCLARLHPDGSVEAFPTFSLGTGVNDGVHEITSLAIQADGKILLGGDFTSVSGVARNGCARLANSVALQFVIIASGSTGQWLRSGPTAEVEQVIFEVSTDNTNWTLLGPGTRSAGEWERASLPLPLSGFLRARGRTSGGSGNASAGFVQTITTFSFPEISVEQPVNTDIPDGGSVNFGSTLLGANTSLTFTIKNTGAASLTGLGITIDGQDAGMFTVTANPTAPVSAPSGSTPFTVRFTPADAGGKIAVLHIANNDLDEHPFDITLYAFGSPAGLLDASFNPSVVGSTVKSMAVQPDGKIVIGGSFISVGGQARSNIARLNHNGTVESAATFNPGAGANNTVIGLAVQADGKILLGGNFSTVGGQTRTRIARLNANGSVESATTFNAGTGPDNQIESVALQTDGKILLGGRFGTVNGIAQTRIARLNADGSVDGTFTPGAGANNIVNSVAVQADGKILLGGFFTNVGGTAVNSIARITTTGAVDGTFNPGAGANNTVIAVAVQPDGKILLGGSFTFVGGQARARIARLNSDGVVDGTFNPGTGANNTVNSIAVQAGGKILLGGDFTSVNGTVFNRIARLNADGSVDATFNLGTGADNTVECVALEADGGVLLGGTFLNVNGVPRNYLARILNDPASQILGILSSAQVRWTRDGSAPEIGQVTFELSLDGGLSWSPLGAGTRTVASWEKTGLSLPVNGTVRARGRTAGGLQNSSSGLVESLVRFGPDSDNDGLLDSWELTYFFTLIGQNALDDSDHDGLNNLEELAFGLNPTFPDSAAQPQVVNEGGYLTITLAKHPGATYLGESGSTPSALSAATTTVLTDNATTLKVRDNILIGTAPARFLHVKITAAP